MWTNMVRAAAAAVSDGCSRVQLAFMRGSLYSVYTLHSFKVPIYSNLSIAKPTWVLIAHPFYRSGSGSKKLRAEYYYSLLIVNKYVDF